MDIPQDVVPLQRCLAGLNKLVNTLQSGGNRGRLHVVFTTLNGENVYYRDCLKGEGTSKFFVVGSPSSGCVHNGLKRGARMPTNKDLERQVIAERQKEERRQIEEEVKPQSSAGGSRTPAAGVERGECAREAPASYGYASYLWNNSRHGKE